MSNNTWKSVGNGHLESFGLPSIADLDPSKLIITLTDSPKPLPNPENLVFGTTMSDHMLVASFDPVEGWSAPEIKPYGPLSLDPASTCFQYAANIFEGMKAHLRPDGTPILFRPEMNVARLGRSADRLALPPFNPNALLELIRKLVALDKAWIPIAEGCSLYIRPTIIGTRPALGVGASDRALLYVIMSPSGPYFRKGPTSISLLAATQNVRAWPGGTGAHKVAGNYAPGFLPQLEAAKLGYDQVLWLLKETGEDAKKKGGWRVTEAGAMNIFVVLSREDGDLDIVTPSLDGTILPGVTRDSVLHLCKAHTDKSKKLSLPGIPPTQKLYTHEITFTIADMFDWLAQHRLLEAFAVGTAAVVAPVGKIGFMDRPSDSKSKEKVRPVIGETAQELEKETTRNGIRDLILPCYEAGMGPVSFAVRDTIVRIQEGRAEWDGWGVPCL